MRLSSASEPLMNRVAVRDYIEEGRQVGEYWRIWLFNDYRKEFREEFGPRLHTFIDSSRRRLDVWYVSREDWPCPFWITSHGDRGTDYEVLPSATDEQCVELAKKLAFLVNGNGARI